MRGQWANASSPLDNASRTCNDSTCTSAPVAATDALHSRDASPRRPMPAGCARAPARCSCSTWTTIPATARPIAPDLTRPRAPRASTVAWRDSARVTASTAATPSRSGRRPTSTAPGRSRSPPGYVIDPAPDVDEAIPDPDREGRAGRRRVVRAIARRHARGRVVLPVPEPGRSAAPRVTLSVCTTSTMVYDGVHGSRLSRRHARRREHAGLGRHARWISRRCPRRPAPWHERPGRLDGRASRTTIARCPRRRSSG